MKIQREVTVVNEQGLHARPAMQLVECASGFDSDVTLIREADGETTTADAKSVLQLIQLVATQGTQMQLECEGDDAEAAADAVQQLFATGFDEMG